MTDNPPTDKENCYRWEYRTVMVIIVAVVIECMQNTQFQYVDSIYILVLLSGGQCPDLGHKNNIAADIAN